MAKKNVIITGATGMVGGHVLEECLKNTEINKITSLVRRPSGLKNKKLTEVIVSNFLDYSTFEDYFKGQDIAIYCLAVYADKVTKEEYKKITIDYTKVFVGTLKRNSPNSFFCLFSAQGADSKEKSKMMFARVKGAAENVVLNQHFTNTYIFRPGYIYPVVPRKEPTLFYKISRKMYPILKLLYPNGVVTSIHLAKAMMTVGIKGGDHTIYENKDIRGIKI